MVIPARSRIVLPAPSQPSTRHPVNVRTASSGASALPPGPGRRSSGPVGPSSPETSAPRWKLISGCCADPGEQQLFQVGLVEHVGLGEAVHACLLPAEFGHHLVPGVEQAQPAARPGPGQEAVADAETVQDPGDLVVEVHRARQRMRLEVAFQQGDRDRRSRRAAGRRWQPTGPAPTTMTGWAPGRPARGTGPSLAVLLSLRASVPARGRCGRVRTARANPASGGADLGRGRRRSRSRPAGRSRGRRVTWTRRPAGRRWPGPRRRRVRRRRRPARACSACRPR